MREARDSLVLVVGATGTVGGAALRSLLAQGARVRALVRSPLDPSRLPNVEVVAGDLGDELSVKNALNGAGAAFYVSPHEPEEERFAEVFVQACEASGTRLVFAGVYVDAPTRLGRAFRRFLFGRFLSHYAPKFRVGERVRACRARPIVLAPANFFQNDELFREELLGGRFVQPFARPVNRVDARDIGDAAARACLEPSLPSGAYPILGPESLDGQACAAAWSAELGRPVVFDPDGPGFESALGRELAGKKRADFAASYAAIRKLAVPTREQEVARTSALLGRPPASYAAYVRETARRWRTRGLARAV